MRVLAAILLFLPLTSLAQASYPTKQAVTDAVKDAEYALRRFQDMADRVDFDRWSVPADLRVQKREVLRKSSELNRRAMSAISRIEHSRDPTSGVDLFLVYDGTDQAWVALDDLSNGTLSFQDKDSEDVSKAEEAAALAQELARASSTAAESQAKLFELVLRLIAAEEAELAKCRAKPH